MNWLIQKKENRQQKIFVYIRKGFIRLILSILYLQPKFMNINMDPILPIPVISQIKYSGVSAIKNLIRCISCTTRSLLYKKKIPKVWLNYLYLKKLDV